MTISAQLVRAAEQMMGKGGSTAKGAWARGAALLTRQAIETNIRDIWSKRHPDLARCPARIQLICLPAAGLDQELVRQARHTWSLLSAACHHHPYDVAPSADELAGWVRVAAQLNNAVAARKTTDGA